MKDINFKIKKMIILINEKLNENTIRQTISTVWHLKYNQIVSGTI